MARARAIIMLVLLALCGCVDVDQLAQECDAGKESSCVRLQAILTPTPTTFVYGRE